MKNLISISRKIAVLGVVAVVLGLAGMAYAIKIDWRHDPEKRGSIAEIKFTGSTSKGSDGFSYPIVKITGKYHQLYLERAKLEVIIPFKRRNFDIGEAVVLEDNVPPTTQEGGDNDTVITEGNGELYSGSLKLMDGGLPDGNYTLQLKTADPNGVVLAKKDFVLAQGIIPGPQPVNHPPKIVGLSHKIVVVGDLLTFYVAADDLDDPNTDGGKIAEYASANLPGGAILDKTTGFFKWTPNVRVKDPYINPYTIIFTAKDKLGAVSDPVSITVTVIDAPAGYGAIQQKILQGKKINLGPLEAYYPMVRGDKIYYEKYKPDPEDQSDIWVYDITKDRESPVSASVENKELIDAYGDYAAYMSSQFDKNTGTYSVLPHYVVANSSGAILFDTQSISGVKDIFGGFSIYGNTLAWVDQRENKSSLADNRFNNIYYAANFVANSNNVSLFNPPLKGYQGLMSMYDQKIVYWDSFPSFRAKGVVYDLRTQFNQVFFNDSGVESIFEYRSPFRIYGDKIAWSDKRELAGEATEQVYVYDIAQNTEIKVSGGSQNKGDKLGVKIYNNSIVWSDNYGIYLYKLPPGQGQPASDEGVVIQLANAPAEYPDISENTVVWQDNHNIYMAQLTPQASLQAPSNLSAEFTGKDIKLSWVNNSDDKARFKVERKEGRPATKFREVKVVGAGITTATLPFGGLNTPYYFRVKAANGTNSAKADSAYSNEAGVYTAAAPLNFMASGISLKQVFLYWIYGARGSRDQAGFIVERKDSPTGNYAQIGSAAVGPESRYIDNTVTLGNTYYYRVAAVFGPAGLKGAYSEGQPASPVNKPVAPSNLVATAISDSEIKLTWNDNSDNEIGFTISGGAEG